jgi:hypothetical protein
MRRHWLLNAVGVKPKIWRGKYTKIWVCGFAYDGKVYILHIERTFADMLWRIYGQTKTSRQTSRLYLR